MIIRKIEYKFSQTFGPMIRNIRKVNLNWGLVVFSFVCMASITLLSVNIYRTIRKGYERYEIIQSERVRLEKLIEKNLQLKEDLKYYSSKEYIDLKAREELNLVFPDQKLVYVEKPKEVNIIEEDEVYEEELKPSWKHWYDLIF